MLPISHSLCSFCYLIKQFSAWYMRAFTLFLIMFGGWKNLQCGQAKNRCGNSYGSFPLPTLSKSSNKFISTFRVNYSEHRIHQNKVFSFCQIQEIARPLLHSVGIHVILLSLYHFWASSLSPSFLRLGEMKSKIKLYIEIEFMSVSTV